MSLLLQKSGIDVNQNNTTGTTALYLASRKGHTEVLKLLLQENGVDVNVREAQGECTALHLASMKGHVDVVELLLQVEGIDMDAQATMDGARLTAVDCAVAVGNTEIISRLLQRLKLRDLAI